MIYLIDDDLSVRRGFELFFKSADMEFKSLATADDFLSRFFPVQRDLIILDLSLPGTSGCDLLKKLYDNGIQVPVVVVTSLDDSISRETCQKYGVKAFLRKPVDGEALIDIIKYHLVN
jgi:FixJ family two-component response regulator